LYFLYNFFKTYNSTHDREPVYTDNGYQSALVVDTKKNANNQDREPTAIESCRREDRREGGWELCVRERNDRKRGSLLYSLVNTETMRNGVNNQYKRHHPNTERG